MKDVLLTVDCSLRRTGVAVCRGGTITSEGLDLGRRQAAELPLMARRVLEKAGCDLKETGLTAVTVGPGYFTGLRVGAAWVTALAYGLGVKVVPVCTLRMLAYSRILRSQPVLAVAYAGRGYVYAASFGCGANLPAGEHSGADLRAWLERREGTDPVVVSDDPERAVESAGLACEVLRVLPDAAIAARIVIEERQPAVPPTELRIAYHRAPQGMGS